MECAACGQVSANRHVNAAYRTLTRYAAHALAGVESFCSEPINQVLLGVGAAGYGYSQNHSVVAAVQAGTSALGALLGIGQLLKNNRILRTLQASLDSLTGRYADWRRPFCRLLLVSVIVSAAYRGVPLVYRIVSTFFRGASPYATSSDTVQFLCELMAVGLMTLTGVVVCRRHINTVLSIMSLIDFRASAKEFYNNLVSSLLRVLRSILETFGFEGSAAVLQGALDDWNLKTSFYTDEEFEQLVRDCDQLVNCRVTRAAPYGTPALSEQLKREVAKLDLGDARLTTQQKTRLTNLMRDAAALIEENNWRCEIGSKRPPPLGVWICGASNIGKSWATENLMQAFWKEFKAQAPPGYFPSYLMELPEKGPLYYTRHAESEFFEGLTAQPIIYYGEAFMNVYGERPVTQAVVDRETRELQSLLDTVPFYPNYASLSTTREPGKGTAIAPVAVFAVSNYMKIPLSGDPYILGRRFDHAYLAVLGTDEKRHDCSHLRFYRKRTTLFTNGPGTQGRMNWDDTWTELHQLPKDQAEFDVWPWRDDWELVDARDLARELARTYMVNLARYRNVFERAHSVFQRGFDDSVHAFPAAELVWIDDDACEYDGERFTVDEDGSLIRESTGERWVRRGEEIVYSPAGGYDCQTDLVEVATSGADNSCLYDAIRMATGTTLSTSDIRMRIEKKLRRSTTYDCWVNKPVPLTSLAAVARQIGASICVHIGKGARRYGHGPHLHVRYADGHFTYLKPVSNTSDKFAKAVIEALKRDEIHLPSEASSSDESTPSPGPSSEPAGARQERCDNCGRHVSVVTTEPCGHDVCKNCELDFCPVCPRGPQEKEKAESLRTVTVGRFMLSYRLEQGLDSSLRRTISALEHSALRETQKLPLNAGTSTTAEGLVRAFWPCYDMRKLPLGISSGLIVEDDSALELLWPLLEQLNLLVTTNLVVYGTRWSPVVAGRLDAEVSIVAYPGGHIIWFWDELLPGLLGLQKQNFLMAAMSPDRIPGGEKLAEHWGPLAGTYAYITDNRSFDAFCWIHNLTPAQFCALYEEGPPATLSGARLVVYNKGAGRAQVQTDLLRSALQFGRNPLGAIGGARDTSFQSLASEWFSARFRACTAFFTNFLSSDAMSLATANMVVGVIGGAVLALIANWFGRDDPPAPDEGEPDERRDLSQPQAKPDVIERPPATAYSIPFWGIYSMMAERIGRLLYLPKKGEDTDAVLEISDDDVERFQAACDRLKIRAKPLERFDAVKYGSCLPMNLRACNFVRVELIHDGEVAEALNGICLPKGVVVFPRHLLSAMGESDTLRVNGNSYGWSQVVSQPCGETLDIAVITKSRELTSGVNTDYFSASNFTTKSLDDMATAYVIIFRDGDIMLQEARVEPRQITNKMQVRRGSPMLVKGYVVHGAHVLPGDCGSLLVAKGKIAGFLSAAWDPSPDGAQESFWTALDRMLVNDLVTKYGHQAHVVSKAYMASYDGPCRPAQRHKMGQRIASFEAYPVEPVHVQPNERKATEIRDAADPDHIWAPTACTPHALELAMAKFPKASPPPLPVSIYRAAEYYKMRWRPLAQLQPASSFTAAANGFLDDTFLHKRLNRIDLSTSPGKPFTERGNPVLPANLSGLSDKSALYTEENGHIVPCETLKRMADTYYAGLLAGVVPRTPFTVNLKNEIRTMEAHLAEKTRLFVAPGAHVVLAVRRLLIDWIGQMKRHGRDLFHAVGINPHDGTQWGNLASAICRPGWRILCPDFSAYDTSHPTELVLVAADVVASYYDQKYSAAIRAAFVSSHLYEVRLGARYGANEVMTRSGLASGSQITTNINCVLTALIYLGAINEWVDNWSAVERNFALVCYGDDALLSCSPEIDIEAFATHLTAYAAQLGYRLTDADKSGPPRANKMETATFLKRRFVRDHDGQILAPLPEEQIFRPLCFYPDGGPGPGCRESTIRAVISELIEFESVKRGDVSPASILRQRLKKILASDPTWAAASLTVGVENFYNTLYNAKKTGSHFQYGPSGDLQVVTGATPGEWAKCQWSY
nr:MAG: RNA-dependent RNA polymerase [Riboviria sp.]